MPPKVQAFATKLQEARLEVLMEAAKEKSEAAEAKVQEAKTALSKAKTSQERKQRGTTLRAALAELKELTAAKVVKPPITAPVLHCSSLLVGDIGMFDKSLELQVLEPNPDPKKMEELAQIKAPKDLVVLVFITMALDELALLQQLEKIGATIGTRSGRQQAAMALVRNPPQKRDVTIVAVPWPKEAKPNKGQIVQLPAEYYEIVGKYVYKSEDDQEPVIVKGVVLQPIDNVGQDAALTKASLDAIDKILAIERLPAKAD